MTQNTPYLSVIIPAYNEEKRITPTLASIYTYLTHQEYTWEMLIVLDGCTDRTIDSVQAFAEGKTHIRWIDRQENHGKGYTVRQGMLAARGQIRLFTDADNSTDIAHFNPMQKLFEQGANVVICSRDSKDAEGARQAVPQPAFKRLLGNLGNLFIQLVAVPGIWDTQCGFKAFSATATQQIFPITLLDGWVFDIEALALARYFGYPVKVVAAHWVDNEDSHVSSSNYLTSIVETLKVRWNLMRGVYRKREQQLHNENRSDFLGNSAKADG